MIEIRDDAMMCPIAAQAERQPEHPAVIAGDRTVGYGALDERVRMAAAGLLRAGIGRGDRVALVAPTSVDTIALLFACFRIGAVAAPLSLRLPEPALVDRCRQVRAALLIANEGAGARGIQTLPLDEVFAEAAESSRHVWQLEAPATIVFTSGSTGDAKAVLHALGNHVYNALGSAQNIPLEPGDRWLLVLPLYHVGGLAILFRCFLAGATVVIGSGGRDTAADVLRHHPTHLSLVATQLKRLIEMPLNPKSRIPNPKLKAVLLGGSAIPPGLLNRALERGLPVHVSYGMSEMASQITTTPPGADRETLATSGFVLPHREVRIDDGAVHVRGRTRFLGYARGEVLEQPFDTDGWFRTGDTGRFDAAGRLVITGRLDDMFISGGENIQPREIERVLSAVRGVADAVVVPVPDAEFGQRPVAFVEQEAPIDREKLDAAVKASLPRFMIPKAYYTMPRPDETRLKRDRQALAALARKLED